MFTTKTTNEGTYQAQNLEPGRYTVRFELQGFTSLEVPEVNLLVGRILRVDGKMQVGSTEQSVQVTEAAPLIDTTRTMVAHNLTAEEIDRLPKGRSFQSLVLTAPSVNAGDIEGGFQVNGASGAENQFNIDGVSTTSLVNGKSRQNAVFEILQEVQVKTSGMDAEFGGALGGVISAITKSGGNEHHGDLHYYFSGSSISAGPVKRLLMDPATQRTAKFVQDYNNPDKNHEIGGSLGGAIVKQKLFYFIATSPRFRKTELPTIFAGGERDTFEREQRYHMAFGKIDFNPHDRIRTHFTYLWTPTQSEGSLPGFNYEGNTVTQSLAASRIRKQIGFFSPQSSYTGQIDLTPTATSLVTVRAGRFWDNFKTTGIPGFSAVEYGNTAVGLPFAIPANLQQAQGFNNTPRLRNTYYDLVSRTYIQTDASKFLSFLGQHNIKGGWGFTKVVNKVDDSYPGGGFVRVYWNTPFVFRGVSDRGQYGYYEVNDIGTRGTTGAGMSNLYIQDQWRVIPRLTLSLGVRFENEKIPTFRRDIRDYAFQFGFADKIAPRLGASFDVFGDGRVKVFGAWGRYYDWVKYELSRGTFGGDLWKIRYRSLDTTDVFSLSGTNMPGRNIWTGGEFRDRRVPAFDLVGRASSRWRRTT